MVGGGGAHECCMSHVIPQYNMWHIWWRVSQGKHRIKCPKYWSGMKGKKSDALERFCWYFWPQSNWGGGQLRISMNWCYLREGGKQIFGLSLSGWNCRIGRKCAFYVGQLCPGRSRGRGRQQPIGSAHFWSYASLSPFLILCIISDHIAISDHLPYCRQQRASSFTSIKFLLSVNHYRSTCNSWMRKSQKFGFRFIKKTPMWQSTSPKTTQAETESIEGLMFWPVHQYCPLFHILYLLDNMYTSYWS